MPIGAVFTYRSGDEEGLGQFHIEGNFLVDVQLPGKLAESHIGDQGQLVQLLHLTAQHTLVHPLALLIDTKAQPPPNFLTAFYL